MAAVRKCVPLNVNKLYILLARSNETTNTHLTIYIYLYKTLFVSSTVRLLVNSVIAFK